MRTTFDGSFQSKLMLRVLAFVPSSCAKLVRDVAHLRRVRPADAELQRPAHRRPKLQRADARQHRVEVLANAASQPLAHGWPLLEALRHDDGLARRSHSRAARRAADRSGSRRCRRRTSSGRCPGSALQRSSRALHGDFASPRSRTLLRQRQVDQQLRPVGRREELLLHEAACPQSDSTNSAAVPAITKYFSAQHAIEEARGTSARTALGSWPAMLRRSCRQERTPVSGVNSTATNQDATSAMPHHREQREAVFAGAALGEARRARSRRSSPACRSASETPWTCRRTSPPKPCPRPPPSS